MGLGIVEDSKLTGDHGCRPSRLPAPLGKVSDRLRLHITHTMLGVLNSKGSLDKRVKITVTRQTLFR